MCFAIAALQSRIFDKSITFQAFTQELEALRQQDPTIKINAVTQSIIHKHLPSLLPGFLKADDPATENSVYQFSSLNFEIWLNILSCCELGTFTDNLLCDTSVMMMQMEEVLPLSTLATLLFKLGLFKHPDIQVATFDHILFSVNTLLYLHRNNGQRLTSHEISRALCGLQNLTNSIEVNSLLLALIPYIDLCTQQKKWFNSEQLGIVFRGLRNMRFNSATSALLRSLIPHIQQYSTPNQRLGEESVNEITATIDNMYAKSTDREHPTMVTLLSVLISI